MRTILLFVAGFIVGYGMAGVLYNLKIRDLIHEIDEITKGIKRRKNDND